MKADKIRDEIDKMDLSEKLLLVEDIWDSIAAIVVHAVFDNRQDPKKRP